MVNQCFQLLLHQTIELNTVFLNVHTVCGRDTNFSHNFFPKFKFRVYDSCIRFASFALSCFPVDIFIKMKGCQDVPKMLILFRELEGSSRIL